MKKKKIWAQLWLRLRSLTPSSTESVSDCQDLFGEKRQKVGGAQAGHKRGCTFGRETRGEEQKASAAQCGRGIPQPVSVYLTAAAVF